MNMLKKWKIFLIINSFLFLSLFICGCSLFSNDNNSPKFSITKPVYKKGPVENSCLLGGVFFDLYNKSENTIIYFEVKMNVFDKETNNNAFPKVGTMKLGMNCEIQSGEMKNLCIPLDKYIVVAKEDYVIDQFYISKICYSDGTEWQDIFGVYSETSED